MDNNSKKRVSNGSVNKRVNGQTKRVRKYTLEVDDDNDYETTMIDNDYDDDESDYDDDEEEDSMLSGEDSEDLADMSDRAEDNNLDMCLYFLESPLIDEYVRDVTETSIYRANSIKSVEIDYASYISAYSHKNISNIYPSVSANEYPEIVAHHELTIFANVEKFHSVWEQLLTMYEPANFSMTYCDVNRQCSSMTYNELVCPNYRIRGLNNGESWYLKRVLYNECIRFKNSTNYDGFSLKMTYNLPVHVNNDKMTTWSMANKQFDVFYLEIDKFKFFVSKQVCSKNTTKYKIDVWDTYKMKLSSIFNIVDKLYTDDGKSITFKYLPDFNHRNVYDAIKYETVEEIYEKYC